MVYVSRFLISPSDLAFLIILVISFLVFVMLSCARLFSCALWSPAGKRLTSRLSFVMSNCEFVTFLLVALVRCGT